MGAAQQLATSLSGPVGTFGALPPVAFVPPQEADVNEAEYLTICAELLVLVPVPAFMLASIDGGGDRDDGVAPVAAPLAWAQEM